MEYIIFGCGEFTKRILPKIEAVLEIKYVCDNNEKLFGKKWMDKYYCLSTEEMYEQKEYPVLISVGNDEFYLQIKQQLEKHNIIAEHVNDVISREWIKNDYELESEMQVVKKEMQPKIVLLGAPAHSNMGDQAQSYCFELIVNEQYPDKKLYIFEGNLLREDYYYRLYLLKQILKKEDIIVIHSGYHCTDIFLKEERLNEKIIELFLNKKLLMLPQTINFKSAEVREKSSEIFSSHNNLTILCRDYISYEYAKECYSKNRLLLYPDIVTSLIGRRAYDYERKGILLCIRDTCTEESNFTEDSKKKLEEKLNTLDNVTITDTDAKQHWREIRKDRRKIIEDEISYYAKFRVIVTDRYHGMIFSLIANTPVVVLPSTDHKITSGTAWFPMDKFKGFHFAQCDEEIISKVESVLTNYEEIRNLPYLYDKYYKTFDLLKQMEE